MLCFTRRRALPRRVPRRRELVTEATSFGGTRTTAERRARWGGDDVPEGYIRLSAGCEDPDALSGRDARVGAALGAP